ncbi:ATP-dependent Clp protease ATP-binding subunit, partial [Bacteroides fragilis]
VAKQIFNLHFGRLQEQLMKQKNIQLHLSDEALQHLADKGYSPKYGARPIAGIIRTYIKKSVSRLIVSEQIRPGDNIVINYRNGELIWEQC